MGIRRFWILVCLLLPVAALGEASHSGGSFDTTTSDLSTATRGFLDAIGACAVGRPGSVVGEIAPSANIGGGFSVPQVTPTQEVPGPGGFPSGRNRTQECITKIQESIDAVEGPVKSCTVEWSSDGNDILETEILDFSGPQAAPLVKIGPVENFCESFTVVTDVSCEADESESD